MVEARVRLAVKCDLVVYVYLLFVAVGHRCVAGIYEYGSRGSIVLWFLQHTQGGGGKGGKKRR